MQRRRFLAGASVAGMTGLGVFAGSASAKKPGKPTKGKKSRNLVKTVQQRGHYSINDRYNPGAVPGLVFSEKQPLKVSTDDGKELEAGPRKGGVQLQIDLPEGRGFGAAGVSVGAYPLGEIDEIEVETSGDPAQVVLAMDIDGEGVYEWEGLKGKKRRWKDWGDDDRALSRPRFSGEEVIGSDEPIFYIPGDGPVDAASDVSVDDLHGQFGDIEVNVAVNLARIAGDDGNVSNRTQVDTIEVVT